MEIPGEPYEAVLVLDAAGAPSTLLVALADNSAPATVDGAQAQLRGDAVQSWSFASVPSAPGHHSGNGTALAPGPWAGTIEGSGPAGPWLAAIPAFEIGAAPHAEEPAQHASLSAPLLTLVAAVLVAATAAAILRRRGAAMLLFVLGAPWIASSVGAHGDEAGHTHEGPKAPTVQGGITLPLDAQFFLGLRTERATRGPFVEHRLGFGTVVPADGADGVVLAPAAGIVRFGAVGLGDAVARGEPLAVVEERLASPERVTVEAEHGAARVAVAEAQAELRLAERDLDATVALGPSLTPRERLERETRVDRARASLAAAEAALRSTDPRSALLAPLAGRVVEFLAPDGSRVEAGQSILRVDPGEAPWAEVQLADGPVDAGAATLYVGGQGVPLPATVRWVSDTVDARAGTRSVRLALDAGAPVRLGQRVEAWVPAAPPRDAVTIPAAALTGVYGPAAVFVKTGPERFERRDLSLGARAGDRVEVRGGLRVGERVVVRGVMALRGLSGR